ncbi:hypothetical protein IEN52_09645 [Stenotrophomonas rhizophila]|nr:XVIPCD domain-containing protein [Stenotrophomonas rhizophila]MCC7634397.1 hypothetical protein [Stenotrophomonas rhizophila]MCC7663795.1 hypothetical protein [Stenotrophomonas rhizophila]
MPRKGPILQDHHVLEQQTFANSELLKILVRGELVGKDAAENRIFMPSDPQLAHALGVSPHSGGPISDYRAGLDNRLLRLEESEDGIAALAGDRSAQERVATRVNHLRDTMTVGLVNGDLYTNAPLGLSADDIRPRTQAFFHSSGSYSQINAQQIGTLNSLSPVDRGYLAIAQSESRIITLLQFAQQSDSKLTAGKDVELQRYGLAQAISNAHHDGRVVMSEQGIRTVEQMLGAEAASPLRLPRGQQGFVSMDLLLGEASARNLVRTGGLLATGADAIMTARRAAELIEQGNTTAAQSEVNHALARNAGGWIGGGSTALALGGSGFLPAAVVAADALLLSKAFEKGADLRDNWAIYHQTDKADVDWKFDGRNWERQTAFDSTSDGRSSPVERDVVASYQKSQELGAMASAKAVELALGKVPPPQDPFKIPAQPSDRRGLDNQDWHRKADTLAWERQIKTSVSGANDRGSYENQTATPERARQLNQEALVRIEGNISNGREAIAAAYLESHAAQRAQDYRVDVPAAVETARAKPDVVLGSDGQVYQRNDAGEWASRDGLAHGNLAMELELTNLIRQPSLERSQQELADIQALPAPTAAQAEKNELLHRYRSASIDLNVNPDTQQAIGLAVQRTLEVNGVTGPTMQQLRPDGVDKRGFDSPIIHFQTGPDGAAHQVAITSSEALRQALNDVRAHRREQAPIPDTPELRIAALSPDERDAYEQTLRYANRHGISAQEASRVAALAAVNVHAPQMEETRAPQAAVDAQRQRDANPAPDAVTMAAASAPIAASPPIAPERPEQIQPFTQRDAPRPEPEVQPAPAAVDDSTRQDMHVGQPAPMQPVPSAQQEHQVPLTGARTQDTSQQPAAPGTTQRQSIDDHPQRSQALPAQSQENAPAAPVLHAPVPPVAMTPMQGGHPDHALYQQIREQVTALDARHGRSFDATSERMTASLLVLAKGNGLDRVDHVVLSNATADKPAGHNVFVVQGELNNPAHQRAHMPTEQAAQTPVEASLQRFGVVSQEQQQRQQAQQLQDAREQQASQARGMSMG